MDPIRNLLQSIPAPAPRSAPSGDSAPVLPKPAEAPQPLQLGGEEVVAEVERHRTQAVVKAAGDIANSRILGTQTFTMFKDMSGQIVTRFFDSSSGKVTYIPEPELLRRAQNSAGPSLKLDA